MTERDTVKQLIGDGRGLLSVQTGFRTAQVASSFSAQTFKDSIKNLKSISINQIKGQKCMIGGVVSKKKLILLIYRHPELGRTNSVKHKEKTP